MTASPLLIGRAPAFRDVVALVDRIAAYDVPVVIEGETGTGKELVARAIHYGSARRDAAFVPVNCGAIPETLIENELFGHERGAFTDARSTLPGLVEVAHRGTLFLDEVDTLSPRAQVSLLRFLQDQKYRPLGARVDRQSDARIVAASNKNLEQVARDGVFRIDLLFRLKLMSVVLPPLRCRAGDASLLAHHFVNALNARYGQTQKSVGPELQIWLESQRWPGNVRELENFIHRQYLLTDGPELTPPPDPDEGDSLREGSKPVWQNLDYRVAKAAALAEFDRSFLRALLEHTRGNISMAAKLARKERRALGKMVRKYGFRPELFKTA